jgi:pimeloyl-ACP methyl ester carboxylesterase
MVNVFDLFDATRQPALPRVELDALSALTRSLELGEAEIEAFAATAEILATSLLQHSNRIQATHSERLREFLGKSEELLTAFRQAQQEGRLGADWTEYMIDAAERLVLTADVLRARGDLFLEHEAAGCPPVLIYDYDIVMDGRDLPYPSNYMLLRIVPPEGVSIDASRRPFIVIDPRAGHGPGIGGFKADSQVGVALRAGHPVYFIAFRREPEPGQFLAYVTRSEAAFVREVMRRHPQASKPIVIGNCQGGWATLLLAAANPDLTGPVVINGAPVAPWSGRVGENPMRYNAGVLGGTWIPMLLSDLGGGIFDGAHLVQNFELLNPGRTLFRKYTDLLRDVDTAEASFLEFEKWWGGFFLLNEPEIRWIVEQLFVGNRLVKNEARIEPGRPVDLKAIRAPIIVFASHGDNITPPQQALNWIAETYSDVQEIRIRGQRIIYMVHNEVGHLGIFVSSKIANREHSEMASTLQTIEALAPGLYEMRIQDVHEQDGRKHFTVDFVERSFDDIRALDDGHLDERPFAAVARASEVQAQIYDAMVRPFVKAVVTDTFAEMTRALHPQRLSRALASSRNPLMTTVAATAETVRSTRAKARADSPFLGAEALWVSGAEQMLDFWRDSRDMSYELLFHSIWGTPWARAFGRTHEGRRTLKSHDELRGLPEVAIALSGIESGGFAEAVIRMLVLLAEDRGEVRRDRLERSSRVLTEDEPFRSLGADRRAVIIHQQALIATYETERAIETLPVLLSKENERAQALKVVRFIPGPMAEMSPRTLGLIERFAAVLGLPAPTDDVTEDPLAAASQPGPHTVGSSPAEGDVPADVTPRGDNPDRQPARSSKSSKAAAAEN